MPRYIQLTPVNNSDPSGSEGVASGLLSGLAAAMPYLIAIAVVAVALYYVTTPESKRSIGGAVDAVGRGISAAANAIGKAAEHAWNKVVESEREKYEVLERTPPGVDGEMKYFYARLDHPGISVSPYTVCNKETAIWRIRFQGQDIWTPSPVDAAELATLVSGGFVGPEDTRGRDAWHYHLLDRADDIHIFFGFQNVKFSW